MKKWRFWKKESQSNQGKDFSLNSGERQVSSEMTGIRLDHRLRYGFASETLCRMLRDTRNCIGLDVFCGVGYGTHILQNDLGSTLIGIDGSVDAIALADKSYRTQRTFFAAKTFPFSLPAASFDFVVSLESLEHVAKYDKLFSVLSDSLKAGGLLLMSTPNEILLPYDQYRSDFADHHVRHFTTSEIQYLAESNYLSITSIHAQNVYALSHEKVVKLLDPAEMAIHAGEGQFNIYLFQKE